MKITRTRQMMHLALFAAISFVLYYLEIPVFMALKMDFSDVPVMVGTYAFGPIFGFMVALTKNILHFFFKAGDFAGALANFFFAILLIVPIGFSRRKKRNLQLAAYAIWVPIGAVIMHYLNYFITFPLYYGEITPELVDFLWTAFFPFNLIKGAILLFIVWVINPKLNQIYKDII